ETLSSPPPQHLVTSKFPPPAPRPRTAVPKISHAADLLVASLLREAPELYRRSGSDPSDRAADVGLHARLLLQANASPSADAVAGLLEAERAQRLEELRARTAAALAGGPPGAASFGMFEAALAATPHAKWCAGARAALDHAVVTGYLKLPEAFYHDFLHGRDAGEAVAGSVGEWKRKFLRGAALGEYGGGGGRFPRPGEAGRRYGKLVEMVGVREVGELREKERRELRDFVAELFHGGRAQVRALLDEQVSPLSVDEHLDLKIEEMLDPAGGLQADYPLFAHDPVASREIFKGDLGDYVRAAPPGTLPPLSREPVYEELREELERVRFGEVTSEMIKFDATPDDMMDDREIRYFAENKEAFISVYEKDWDSDAERDALLTRLGEGLDALQSKAAPSVSEEERADFRKWVCYQNAVDDLAETREQERLEREAVEQGVRSTAAAQLEKERVRWSKGDLLVDGSPDPLFKEKAPLPSSFSASEADDSEYAADFKGLSIGKKSIGGDQPYDDGEDDDEKVMWQGIEQLIKNGDEVPSAAEEESDM
ncbi:hypothetical protein TeGR_g11020, partial [Tetraparma gracilis]